MAQVIVRKLDPQVVDALKRRAEAKGRRLEQELRIILTEAAKPLREERLAEMDAIRARTRPGAPVDVAAFIREDRDSR